MVMLIYAQKRIHFSRKDTYEMRMQLAVLDWVGTKTLLFVLHVSLQKVRLLHQFTSITYTPFS